MDNCIPAGILTAKKYKNLYRPLLERVCREEFLKYKNEKERVKAVKNRLHMMFGAYWDDAGPQKTETLAGELCGTREADETPPLAEALMRRHISTRERLPYLAAFYNFIFARAGTAETVLDLGCGFNPFALPWMPAPHIKTYYALDIDERTAGWLNRYFARRGLPSAARCADLAAETPPEYADIAFLFKLLPVLEQQKKGRGYELLRTVRARQFAVTFPLKTLCGKNSGFGFHYAETFERNIAEFNNRIKIMDKAEIGNELIYMLNFTGSF